MRYGELNTGGTGAIPKINWTGVGEGSTGPKPGPSGENVWGAYIGSWMYIGIPTGCAKCTPSKGGLTKFWLY